MADVAFVLLKQAVTPPAAAVVAAARRYGIDLTPSGAATDGVVSFAISGGAASFEVARGATLSVATVDVPLPDAAQRPVGLTSVPPGELADATAHLIVAALGMTGSARERDTWMAHLTAAVIDTVDAVGALLGHNLVIHKAALFADAARLSADHHEPLMVEVAIDITAAAESETRMSFLTHGLRRYGREELYVTCPIQGTGALDFVLRLSRWLLAEPDKHLPDGDTVGRSADERIVVRRVPDPTNGGGEVIRLDLP